MDIMALCRTVTHMHLRIFRAMKRAMDTGMWAMQPMNPRTSTAPDLQAADGRAAVVIPVVDIRGKLLVLENKRPAHECGPFVLHEE
jgi:hypothetical protein